MILLCVLLLCESYRLRIEARGFALLGGLWRGKALAIVHRLTALLDPLDVVRQSARRADAQIQINGDHRQQRPEHDPADDYPTCWHPELVYAQGRGRLDADRGAGGQPAREQRDRNQEQPD